MPPKYLKRGSKVQQLPKVRRSQRQQISMNFFLPLSLVKVFTFELEKSIFRRDTFALLDIEMFQFLHFKFSQPPKKGSANRFFPFEQQVLFFLTSLSKSFSTARLL